MMRFTRRISQVFGRGDTSSSLSYRAHHSASSFHPLFWGLDLLSDIQPRLAVCDVRRELHSATDWTCSASWRRAHNPGARLMTIRGTQKVSQKRDHVYQLRYTCDKLNPRDSTTTTQHRPPLAGCVRLWESCPINIQSPLFIALKAQEVSDEGVVRLALHLHISRGGTCLSSVYVKAA